MNLRLRGSGVSLLCSLLLGLTTPGVAAERQPRAGGAVSAATPAPGGPEAVSGQRRPKAGLAVAAPVATVAGVPGASGDRPSCGRKYCSSAAAAAAAAEPNRTAP